MEKLKQFILKKIYKILKYLYPIPSVLNRKVTSEMIANNNQLSIVRFGDGELGQIINKNDIGFQKYDEKLAVRLRDIIESRPNADILICIPDVFDDISKLKKNPREYWLRWTVRNRAHLYYLLKENVYGDSLVSRLYLPWIDNSQERIIVENLKSSWKNKSIIIVEGEKTCCGVGNDLFECAKSVKRILCPTENAFNKYLDIYMACMRYSANVDMFLISLGPTATVLAYDLAKQGIRALDLGHVDLQYEYFKRQIDERIKIPGKYNNEIMYTDVENCFDQTYLDSILINLND